MKYLSLNRSRAGLLGLVWLLTIGTLAAQSVTSLSGRVTDETGQVLPGVTVLVKNTSNAQRPLPKVVTGYQSHRKCHAGRFVCGLPEPGNCDRWALGG